MESGDTSKGYPAVRSPFIPIVIDPDTIEFRCGPWAGPVYTIRDQDGEGKLGEVVKLLDGKHSLSEVLDEFARSDRDEIATILERLTEEEVIIDVENNRVEPAGGYISWDQLSDRSKIDGLEDAAVLVVNENLIARTVLRDLARIGVGSMKLFSFEKNDHETSRVDGAGPEIDYCYEESELEEIIAAVDCVVYTEEHPYPDRLDVINEIALTTRTPWIPGRVIGLDGIVGPAIRPGLTCCFECFRTRARGTLDGEAALRELASSHRPTAAPVPKPGFARIVAGYLTLDVINLLASTTAFTQARCIHFDFFSFSVEANTVLKVPRCEVCGPAGTTHVDRQRFLTLSQLLGDEEE